MDQKKKEKSTQTNKKKTSNQLEKKQPTQKRKTSIASKKKTNITKKESTKKNVKRQETKEVRDLDFLNSQLEKEIEEDIKESSKGFNDLSDVLLSHTIFDEESEEQDLLSREIFDQLENIKEEEKPTAKKETFSKDSIKSQFQTIEYSNSSKRRSVVLLDVTLLLICITMFYLLISLTPKMYLNGDTKVKIEYGTPYKEEGAIANYLRKDYTKNIKISGKVDTKKIGTYYITYTLKNNSFHLEKQRIVEVVDRKAPIIELEGLEETKICPNSNYEEEGVKAVDEYDGDLTKEIKIKKEKNKIIYSVKDSSGNETKKVRKLLEVDDEAPVLTLEGSEAMYADFNGTYKEPGYKATDNCEGDLTEKVEVKGTVDTSKLGTYTLTYQVSDQGGNTSEVKRIVTVSRRTDPESGILKTGAIYLTFDDGPNQGTTNRILDILKEEGVKATFFVTCNGPDSLLKREFDEGHSIALHTASHDYSYVYRSEENYFADLKKVSDRVKNVTGHESKLIRFPGGSSNTVSRHYNQGIMTRLTNEVLERGYRYYDWNVDASDAWQCAKSNVSNKKQCVYNNVISNLSKAKANVVLMHDVKEHTVQALRDIIRYGKDNGYSFELIDTGTKMVRFKVNN